MHHASPQLLLVCSVLCALLLSFSTLIFTFSHIQTYFYFVSFVFLYVMWFLLGFLFQVVSHIACIYIIITYMNNTIRYRKDKKLTHKCMNGKYLWILHKKNKLLSYETQIYINAHRALSVARTFIAVRIRTCDVHLNTRGISAQNNFCCNWQCSNWI